MQSVSFSNVFQPRRSGSPRPIFSRLTAGALLLAVALPTGVAAAPHSDPTEIALKGLEAAPGLEVELFASDPLLFNPVAFTIDEKGRFFISETHRYKDAIFDIWAADQRWKDADASFRTVQDRADFLAGEYASNPEALTKDSEVIRLVEDRDGDGKADHTAVFADGFNKPISGTAAGILAHDGEVWFTCIPDLWRFEVNESGEATERDHLHTGYGVHIGVSGHDLHGLVMGPDGKLYFSVGDRGAHVTTEEGTVLDLVDSGGVFRCNPDGSDLEIFATGLRNPQELAFDRYGNLWAHDNDTSGQDKSRVMHIVEGGDYGWRYSYQFMKGFGPWVQEKVWAGGVDDVLPNAGYGAQGPAGLAYYPGVGLPAEFDHHFIACDFPQGVWAYTANPKGASYEIGPRKKFLWNAGPTDVAFGPDGHVYFSDWGKSYQMPDRGRIYRVFDPAQAGDPALAELQKVLGEGMENRPLSELKGFLGHQDMRVRQAAQFELIEIAAKSSENAAQISDLFQNVAREQDNVLARIHAIWGLEALQPKDARQTIATVLNDPEAEVRAQAAKLVGSTSWVSLAPALAERLEDDSPRVRAFAAASLGKIAAQSQLDRATFFEPLLRFLRENDDADPYLTHAGMMALLDAGDFELIEEAAADPSAAVRRAALLCMRRLERKEIVQFLDDADSRVRIEAARAINDVPVEAAMPALAARLTEENLPPEVLSRVINANFRVGGPAGARRLAAFAARHDAPAAHRIEALDALADWANPPARDRVVGLWRPLDDRKREVARLAFSAVAEDILQNAPEDVQIALVDAAADLDAKEVSESLFAFLRTSEVSVPLKQAIPAALVELDFPRLPEMMETVLADENLAVRRAGVELLDQVAVPRTSQLLADLLASESDLRLSQTAIATLGRLDGKGADRAIAQLIDQLLAGQLRRDLHLDVLEAAGKRSSPMIKERLARYTQSLSLKDDPLAEYRPTLAGGDAGLGKKLFHERDDLGCLRCHSVNGKGGVVGPDLAGIGAERSHEYLLESILEPNKHFAPGFERIVLVLEGGKTIAGLVEKETADQVVLLTPETVSVEKEEIATRHNAISAMPKGLEKQMTKQELRDLIEYLGELK